VQALIKQYFNGKEPNRDLDLDETVLYGAAWWSGKIAGQRGTESLQLSDVTAYALGVETKGGSMTVVVPRDTNIPTRKSLVFTTAIDEQEHALIRVLEGENCRANANDLVVTLRLSEILPATRGQLMIEVTFDIDLHGTLTVTAEEKLSHKTATITENENTNSANSLVLRPMEGWFVVLSECLIKYVLGGEAYYEDYIYGL
jgi:heat shock protein 5